MKHSNAKYFCTAIVTMATFALLSDLAAWAAQAGDARSNPCVVAVAKSGDMQSDECRVAAAKLTQDTFNRANFPSLRVQASGRIIVFADPELFQKPEDQASLVSIVKNGEFKAQLCGFGFTRARFESSGGGTLAPTQEFDLDCPVAANPKVAAVTVATKGASGNPAGAEPRSQTEVASSQAVTAMPTSETAKKANTLGGFKRQFLNKQIVIDDVPFEDRYCLEWTAAQQKSDGTYAEAEGIYNHLPIEYKGQTGMVVAIQLAPSFLQRTRVGGTNAFGETVGEDDIADPYMEIIVKFGNGVIGIVRGFPITLVPEKMELASSRESVKEQIESQLPSVVGRKLYAVGFSRLYKPTATVEEMSSPQEILARLSVLDVPLLEPLNITKAKYLPDVGGVVLKISLPNGSEAIVYSPSRYMDFGDTKRDFLSQISGSLLSSIPDKLTPREIKAIKERSLFRGMSADAVDYAIGFKDSENDWGKGGKQRMYLNGKLVVYVDNTNRVEDWQSFD